MSAVLDRPSELAAENQAIAEQTPRRRVRVDAAGRFLWTRELFLEYLSRGDFDTDNKIELLHGEVYFKMTMHGPHILAIYKTTLALQQVFEPNQAVMVQVPFALNEDDFPEPDVAVLQGPVGGAETLPANSPALVVEVSDTTLTKDRTIKAAIYAEAGIEDYWILNLIDRVLECYRQPAPMPSEPLGFGYRSITRFSETDSLAPLAAPQNPMAVASLLP